MDALDVSRWQFGITTVYHFLFVPLTIGLAPLIAVMQTAWILTGNRAWYRMTKFFGKLFLINFALGVATGIVQEFQFGMNWSEYSRFVGDVFGAPLAMEGLVAFFFESTFIGLWIFGWTRLPKLVHLACIWVVAVAVNASAFFIIAANSWMQHPVGARFNPATGRAELTSIVALFTNNTAVAAFSHAVFGAFLTAGTFVAAVCAWWLVAKRSDARRRARIYRPATILGCLVALAAAGGLFLTGDTQGKLMFQQQPMKMASAESLCHTETDPDFSILTVGTHNNCDSVDPRHRGALRPALPRRGPVRRRDARRASRTCSRNYEQTFGPGDYRPNLFVTYWSFRAMIGFLRRPSGCSRVVALWLTRRGRIPDQRWFGRVALLTLPTPFLANSAGWVFTEMGRQPWVVVPNPTGDRMLHLTVNAGVSEHSAALVLLSPDRVHHALRRARGVWFFLMRRYVVEGPLEHDAEPAPPTPPGDDAVAPLSFAY